MSKNTSAVIGFLVGMISVITGGITLVLLSLFTLILFRILKGAEAIAYYVLASFVGTTVVIITTLIMNWGSIVHL